MKGGYGSGGSIGDQAHSCFSHASLSTIESGLRFQCSSVDKQNILFEWLRKRLSSSSRMTILCCIAEPPALNTMRQLAVMPGEEYG